MCWTKTLMSLLSLMVLATYASAQTVVYEGGSGPGQRKHIVFLAGDHEYRSEETVTPKADKAATNQAKKEVLPGESAVAPIVTGKPAQFVRVELPGEKRILTLAEVEVFSGGKNIAKNGKATQSSTNGAAVASRAIDGNKHSDFGKQGQTHTSNAGEKNPWWELDLGQAVTVDKVGIWNRSGFESRLDGFTITLLDAERKVAFRAMGIAAPQALEIDVKTGKLTYLAFDGKPGIPVAGAEKPAKDGGKPAEAKKTKKPNEPRQDPSLANVPADYRDPLPFAFKKGDTVAILGNGLADRMQHDGWLETLLQAELVDQQVRFRTMAASGDRPNDYPRSSGQKSMTAYLRHVQPTVVFAFFGYNESYDAKPAEYRQRLLDFVTRTRGAKPNGKDFPRIVLFSPIAYEDTRNPNVPDGKTQNVRLAAYTRARKPRQRKRASRLWIYFTRRWNCSTSPRVPSPSTVSIYPRKEAANWPR